MSSTLRPSPPPREASAASFARHRALFANFFRRELFSRYLGSISGLAWALLHPLALLAVYHFVFTTIFRNGA
ncbi:MAG TPA: ABC transporter permease, partial [Casimicrobiaceae bacterium]|nr:ABC transporter permease [Casimicrobiaceae bacterium]